MTTVKITELSDIGANLASSTVVPVVNMAGTPITQKTNVGNIANLILEGAGVDYSEASVALLAQTVSNAAQPNITSVGTLTNVVVSGNATVNGNITSNGTAYVGNLSTTGLASITTLDVGTTANLGSIANVIITGGTIGQILSTDGEGNLSWTSDATTYGNSNVVSLLSAFGSNTIVTTGIITADGANLSNVPYANLTGAPSLGNISNINLDGNVSNLLTGNGTYVAIPVVPTVGNIATLNLDGSNSNVLYGNGVFAAVTGGANTGNVTFDDVTVQGDNNSLNLSAGSDFTANLAYLQVRAGDVASHIHLDTGNNDAYDLIVGDDQNYVQVSSTGNILLSSYDSNTAQYTWTLDYNGNLILAGGNSVIQSIANSSLDPTLPNVSTMVFTPDANYNSQILVLDPTAPGHIHLRAYAFSNIDEPAANIFLGGEDTAFEITSGANNEARIHSGGNTWTFDNTGNLTFPRDAVGNIDPILSIVGGATPTIVSTAASLTGPANLAIQSNYLNLSGFTGEKITFFPDDGLIATDYDMVLTTNVGGGNTYTWTLDATGNLNLPGNLVIAGNANVFGTDAALIQTTDNRPLLALSSGANGAVSSLWVEDIGNVGTSNIAAVYANPTPGSKIVRIAVGENGSPGPNLWDFNANGTLTFPGTPRIDTSTNNFEVQAAEAINFEANTVVNIYTDTGNTTYQWQFGDDGNLTLPTGGQIIVSGGLVSSGASPAPSINGFSITNSVGISGNGNIAGNNISATGNVTAINLINTVTVYANLPAATTAGIRAFISDANLAPIGNFGAEVSGGGGNYVPVFSDGANWCIG